MARLGVAAALTLAAGSALAQSDPGHSLGDHIEMAWGVIIVWGLVWAVRILRRAL
jgi:hypothetical protein